MMGYRAESDHPPDHVLAALAKLGHARASSWASGHAWSATRLYCRVEGSTFQASIGGGNVLTGVTCRGSVTERDGGSALALEFRFGAFPNWFPGALLSLSVAAAVAIWLSGAVAADPGLFATTIALPVAIGISWGLRSVSKSTVLADLAAHLDISWSPDRSAG